LVPLSADRVFARGDRIAVLDDVLEAGRVDLDELTESSSVQQAFCSPVAWNSRQLTHLPGSESVGSWQGFGGFVDVLAVALVAGGARDLAAVERDREQRRALRHVPGPAEVADRLRWRRRSSPRP
jgi:hypothetical protein